MIPAGRTPAPALPPLSWPYANSVSREQARPNRRGAHLGRTPHGAALESAPGRCPDDSGGAGAGPAPAARWKSPDRTWTGMPPTRENPARPRRVYIFTGGVRASGGRQVTLPQTGWKR